MDWTQEGHSNSVNLQLHCLIEQSLQLSRVPKSRENIQTNKYTTQYTITQTINPKQAWKIHKGWAWERAAGIYANTMKLSQISGLSNHISKAWPSKALLICIHVFVCVCMHHVWCPVTVLPNGWASKLSNQALLKLCFPSLIPVYVSYLLGQSYCHPSDSPSLH